MYKWLHFDKWDVHSTSQHGKAIQLQHALEAGKDLSPAKPMPRWNELWAQFTVLSRGVKETSCLYRWKGKRRGVPHLLKQQHNQWGGSNRALANKCTSLFTYVKNVVGIDSGCVLCGCLRTCLVRPKYENWVRSTLPNAQKLGVWVSHGSWVVTPCKLTETYWRLRETGCQVWE